MSAYWQIYDSIFGQVIKTHYAEVIFLSIADLELFSIYPQAHSSVPLLCPIHFDKGYSLLDVFPYRPNDTRKHCKNSDPREKPSGETWPRLQCALIEDSEYEQESKKYNPIHVNEAHFKYLEIV